MNRFSATLLAAGVLLFASATTFAQDFRYPSRISYSSSKLRLQAESLIATSSFQRFQDMMPARQLERSPSYTQWWNRSQPTATAVTITLPEWYRNLLLDLLYDYRVEWAEPVDGQIEYVLNVRYPGESEWTRLHRIDWCGSVDHGGYCDLGEYVFTSWYAAYWKGQSLLADGEIDDYEIESRPKTAQWQYLATFDARAEAEEYAAAMEQAASLLGQPRTTRIVAIAE